MSTAVATREDVSPVFPKEQIDLIRRTVANGATNDELALFLYDCQRRGVHPLDKLLHFTKRGGKYTPVTSIDFMRSQAATSGEMAGSDDPTFTTEWDEADQPKSYPKSATVTVYRLTQGQRFAYTATARWTEYCPASGQDHMWRKMPHTMLGKCAEALALRKAFPQQLAGLYSADEMDQADSPKGFVVEAPPPTGVPTNIKISPELIADGGLPIVSTALPEGAVLITKVESGSGKAKGFIHHSGQPVSLKGGDGLAIYDDKLVTLAAEVCQAREPVMLETKISEAKKIYVKDIKRLPPKPPSPDDILAEMAMREMAAKAGEIS